MNERIYLSPPHLGQKERRFVEEAFDSNWVAPLGPHVDAFEAEVARYVGVSHAAALSSGTAAIHLALKLCGVERGDRVFCSTFTFAASANPIVYQGATPVFIDSEEATWNMDPALLAEAFRASARKGKLPKAVIAVDLYGQCADYSQIARLCEEYGVPLIEDAAEALGASSGAGKAGSFGRFGVFSFNGNKIITTSGGGMLVSEDGPALEQARYLATQARDAAPHYQHSQVGYNYRMSNVLAGIGRGQLQALPERIESRRRNRDFYKEALGRLPGLGWMPHCPGGEENYWLTCVTVEPDLFGACRQELGRMFEDANIEARPVWKPLHLQPVFSGCERWGGDVSESIFQRGLCLPSGSNMSAEQLQRVSEVLLRAWSQN